MLKSNCGNLLQSEIFESLNKDELKSIFFLLQDSFKDDFLTIVKMDPALLREKLYGKHFEEPVFVELFGTIKRYDVLKHLGTCSHIFKSQKDEFQNIRKLWKILYEICENLDSNDLISLKQRFFDERIWEHINSGEEIFALALRRDIFSERNLNPLKEAFCNKPSCLNIIEDYKNELSYYPIKQPTQNSPCGIALIINHENFKNEVNNFPYLEQRKGSRIDVEKLETLWKCFGFEVETYEDLSDDEVFHTLDLISRKDHTLYDAFVMCYLSHGSEKTVFTSNNKEIKIEQLISKIANEIPSLNKKPKCFFIQACQGTNIQQIATQCLRPFEMGNSEFRDAIPLDLQRNSNELRLTTCPLYSDVYQVISTIPGFVSFRSLEGGSWFISALYDIMIELGDSLTISDIITLVTEKVTSKRGNCDNNINCAQTPINSSTLCRKLKFKKLRT